MVGAFVLIPIFYHTGFADIEIYGLNERLLAGHVCHVLHVTPRMKLDHTRHALTSCKLKYLVAEKVDATKQNIKI